MAEAMHRPAVIIDNGTGFTKACYWMQRDSVWLAGCVLIWYPLSSQMGFSGNAEPSYLVPTCIGVNDNQIAGAKKGAGLDDLDFHIGYDVRFRASTSCLFSSTVEALMLQRIASHFSEH